MYDASVDILVKGGNKNVDSSLPPCNVLLVAPRSVPYVIVDVKQRACRRPRLFIYLLCHIYPGVGERRVS